MSTEHARHRRRVDGDPPWISSAQGAREAIASSDKKGRQREQRRNRYLENSIACRGKRGTCKSRVPKKSKQDECGRCLQKSNNHPRVRDQRIFAPPAEEQAEICIDVWGPEILVPRRFEPHTDGRACSGECQPIFSQRWCCIVCFESSGHFIELGCDCKGQRLHYECMIKCSTTTCPTCRQSVEQTNWRPARDGLVALDTAQRDFIGTCAFPGCRMPGTLLFDDNVAVLDCRCESLVHPRCAFAHAKSFLQKGRIPCVCSAPSTDLRIGSMVFNQCHGCLHSKQLLSSFIRNRGCSCTTCPCACLPCCVTSFAILSS